MSNVKRLFALCLVVGFMVALVPIVWAQDAQHNPAKININTASADQLTSLKGIGPKYADRIIQFREAHGTFKAAEDIVQIPGIGAKTLEANKDRIIIE